MQKNKNITKMFGICLLLLGIIAIFSFGINASSAANSSSVYVSTQGNDDYDGLNATGTATSNRTAHAARGTTSTANPDPVDLVVTKDVETFEPVWNYKETQAFWITVSNNGPDDATLVKVEDLLPAGLIFDHAIVSTGAFDETTMTWYVGDLVNGGYETLELFVNVTGHNTIVTNTVIATSFETELNPDDNTASVQVTIPAAAHVNLTNEYNNLQGNVINSSNYQQNFWGIIKANNIGPDSTDVILEDVLNTFPFIQFATDQFGENFYVSYNNGTSWIPGSLSTINFQDLTAYGNFFINNMQSGDNVWLKVFLTTDFATGIVNNEATAVTSVYEYLTPGFASANLTVPPAADLYVTKWDDADYIGQPVNYLDFVHYYIEIDNLGPDDATGVLLKDLIPAGLAIDPSSVLASQGTFDPITGIWTVTDGLSPTLGYGNSAFLSFLAQVVGTGAITNSVDVNATTYDPDTTNNHATDTINVPLTPTAITVNPVSGFKGDTVNLIATLTDTHNIPIAGKPIQFSVDGNILGTATTNAQGIATYAYTITQNSGTYTILAQFLQDTTYAATSNTNTLTVNHIPTTITVNPVSGFKGDTVNLIATLTDSNNQPINEGQVKFIVSNIDAGTANVINGIATLSWMIPLNWNAGNYNIVADYLGTSKYDISTNTSILTVDESQTQTSITVRDVTGVNNRTLSLNATLKDADGNPLSGQTVIFHINGHSYSAVTGNNGIATIQYMPYSAGNYNITVNYLGNSNYTASEGTGLLKVNPSAYLYLQITSSNDHPKIGETFTITYKLGNKGPDNANNVTMTIPLPSGFTVSKITGDGKWTYNSAHNTLTWTLSNVAVGDPYLYITGKTNTNGIYVFGSNITSETYNLNTQNVDPISITTNSTNPVTQTNSTTVNAATTTIPMQNTGIPLAGLILAILSVLGGSLMSRKK